MSNFEISIKKFKFTLFIKNEKNIRANFDFYNYVFFNTNKLYIPKNNVLKIQIPHHTNKYRNRSILFDNTEKMEDYINTQTGFKSYMSLMNIKIFINDIYIGKLINNKGFCSWNDYQYFINIKLSDSFVNIFDNSSIFDITEENPYPSPESHFLSEYTIYRHKDIRNLIITVFNFSNNEYLFDFIDDSISNNPEEIKDFVFRKYEDYMY